MNLIAKVYKYVYRKTVSRVYINTNQDINKTIFLASLGRSGSTLIAELINYNNRFRIIFEPFKVNKVSVFKKFSYPAYIDPNNNDVDVYETFKKIFKGDIRNSWTDAQNKKFICEHRLIKEIQANMMLGYISHNFPDMPIILLLRNPYPVIESWKRAKWGVHSIKERILKQRNILNPALPANALKLLKLSNDHLSVTMHIWCISYYISFHHLKGRKYYCAYYENFLTTPETEINAIFNFLNLEFNGDIIKLMKKESAMTRPDSPLRKGENILLSWKKHYTETDIANGNKILKFYELDSLYDFENSFLPANNKVSLAEV